ncbi:MAG TPA: carboxymuconolactone decarboxylase family protein [Hyphomicrobiaceae bacterium]|nr:carboxymuconolactone decarboxylase family protein [Hyphomicrobiaceae bacterium]
MARISQLERTDLPEGDRKLWDQFSSGSRDFSHQVRVLAHSPQSFRHLYGLVEDLRTQGSLPQRLVEIAVVTTSKLNECPYCVAHHTPALTGLGISASAALDILAPRPEGFSEVDVLVRDYARLLTERAWGISDSVFDNLKKHLTERQIVELSVRIGICTLFNKLNLAIQIEPEAGFDEVPEAEDGNR